MLAANFDVFVIEEPQRLVGRHENLLTAQQQQIASDVSVGVFLENESGGLRGNPISQFRLAVKLTFSDFDSAGKVESFVVLVTP